MSSPAEEAFPCHAMPPSPAEEAILCHAIPPSRAEDIGNQYITKNKAFALWHKKNRHRVGFFLNYMKYRLFVRVGWRFVPSIIFSPLGILC